MADSQLLCMEDGRIGTKIPDTKPEFLYSEEQRAAVEELLRNGDGAFKTRLQDDNMKDFLSAREVKHIFSTFKSYGSGEDGTDPESPPSPAEPSSQRGRADADADADSGVHSTYWPQMSDTEVPPLDIGWPSSGFFRGVTRVSVHTHPPKDNGPHIREVVRRLIQESSKLIAIVMDMITDPQILQDLLDAASRRLVPVYILLDESGVPHFLDMCSRLQIGSQHLRNIRTRTLQGVGFNMSFGRLPGSLCYKYMLVDGVKVMFGSYSFCWATFRMDRNMIAVMTGQMVDFFDRDFRELYAISEKLNLYKELNISPPVAKATATPRSKVEPKRPPLPATTSRFQVSLGDTLRPGIQVPAHKFHNPIYSQLVVGDNPHLPRSLQEIGSKRESVRGGAPGDAELTELPRAGSERMDQCSQLPPEPNNTPTRATPEKKGWATLKKKFSKRKSASKMSINSLASSACPSPTPANGDKDEDSFEVIVLSPSKSRGKKHLQTSGWRTDSKQTINTSQDNQSLKSQHRRKGGCKVS